MTEASELPWLARLFNHVLTPGSALSPSVWIAFNCVMAAFFVCFIFLLFVMPDNVHVWAFGFLGSGLAFSTNWLFKEIFSRDCADEVVAPKEGEPNLLGLHEKKND